MAGQDGSFGKLQVYLISFRPERLELFELACQQSGDAPVTFREPVREFDHSSMLPLLVVIYDSKRFITHLGVGYRGDGGGTGLKQIEIGFVHSVGNRIKLDTLYHRLVDPFARYARDAFQMGGLLPLSTSHAVLRELLKEYAAARTVVERALRNQKNPLRELSEADQFAFQQQKDAVLISLSVAGMDRKAHLHPDFNLTRPPRSFLEGLPQARLRESSMLISDLQTFPGFERIRSRVQGAVEFSDGRTRLSVLLVHEQPLEGLVGTDLIYYNENFRSFVMVQYKAMEKDADGHLFRIPNENLSAEVQRMMAFASELEKIEKQNPAPPMSFRLDTNPFFLKFCPRTLRNLDDIDLIPGMYLPLNYWILLEASTQLAGRRGGKALRFENVVRHLSNTTFATFVSNGWAGSTLEQSSILEKVIRRTLETGRAITIAQALTLNEEPPE